MTEEMEKRCILVADDNRDGADSLASLLGMLGHEVHVAYDGHDALIAAEKFRPAVVLLDISMPRLNGYETCRQLRMRPWASDVICIALTGWCEDEDLHRTQEAGFNHYLTKPVKLDTLLPLLAAGAPGKCAQPAEAVGSV